MKEFDIAEFLMQAQHHSGLPFDNSIVIRYILKNPTIFENISENNMNELINNYMIKVHKVINKNRTWKSYDW